MLFLQPSRPSNPQPNIAVERGWLSVGEAHFQPATHLKRFRKDYCYEIATDNLAEARELRRKDM